MTDEVPTEHVDPPAPQRGRSVVLVYTGDGKGKSSAAWGLMLRALARGWKVAVVQFVKSGAWKVGEEKLGRELGVDWWAIGEGFTWLSDDLTRDEAVAKEAWRHARATIEAGEHEVVVLDEITYPVNWGWIDGDEVVRTLTERPPKVSVVATGRNAPEALIAAADTVTEMRKVKHAYDQGIMARKGLDY
ncbi:MAG: cob(I)yrinic acid a,c-diamide adenosyltransferase [Acidimicrobiales bacterium]